MQKHPSCDNLVIRIFDGLQGQGFGKSETNRILRVLSRSFLRKYLISQLPGIRLRVSESPLLMFASVR